MKALGIAAAGLLTAVALSASADIVVDYGWEDGGTVLGTFGNVVGIQNVTAGSDPGTNNETPSYDPWLAVAPNSGTRMLELSESPHSSTPQAYLGYIENLNEGDVVTASFWGWDSTPDGASPSLRIWGHYALNGDVSSYDGSASGSDVYTTGLENGQWSQASYSWTVAAGKQALVIEARLYSTPSTSENSSPYWIDDLQITAPDGAIITTPVPEPSTLITVCLGTALVALSRRRQRARS